MNQGKTAIGCFLAALLAGVSAAGQILHQQHHPPENTNEYIQILESPSRNAWQEPVRVVAKLGLKPGESVADLGSGPGYFTLRLARAVGPAGKVYAIDISRQMLDYLAKQAVRAHLRNIQTVVAEPHDPGLPAASVDMIFLCDTLHHIPDRISYYPLLLRALKPGGRLVNIDFFKRSLLVGPPVRMKIPKAQMIQEAEAAGFHLVRQYRFLKYQYFLVFRR